MDEIMVRVSLYVIGALVTAIGAMIALYLASQLRTLNRLERIDEDTMEIVTETKDRLNTHIGDSTYRFDVLQDRLAKLERTDGDHDDYGNIYQRRRYDSSKPGPRR